MQEQLQDVNFKAIHIYREDNKVAYAIFTYQDFENFIWWDSISEFILNLADKDKYTKFVHLSFFFFFLT